MVKRHYRTPACAGKRSFESAAEARTVMRTATFTAEAKSDLFAYRCRECGAWHIGRGERIGGRPPRQIGKNWNWRKAADED